MSFFNSKTNRSSIWQPLDSEAGLQQLIDQSANQAQVIFKHSTRCSISMMAKDRMERRWNVPADVATLHYLDLIAFRPISQQIAATFGVVHESPQVLVIKNGKAVYDVSHNGIAPETIGEVIHKLA